MALNRAAFRAGLAVAVLAINGWTLARLGAFGALWGILGAVFVVALVAGLLWWANVARKREARRAFIVRVLAVNMPDVTPADVVKVRGVGYWL